MTKTDLLELIKNGENSGVEFKRDTIDNRALAKELVAFTNLQGGKVLLGVADDGAIVGTTREKLEEFVMNTCRDKIRPEIIPYFEMLRNVEPGKDVAVVEVERGWSVHCVWHDNHRAWYIRVGSESREANDKELERLFQQRGAFRLEIRPVSGTSLDDLDMRRLRDYFTRIRQQEVPPEKVPSSLRKEAEDQARKMAKEEGNKKEWKSYFNKIYSNQESEWFRKIAEKWKILLINTEFLIQENDRRPATVAGLLLFSPNPNKFLPQAGIDAVAYPGKEKDYAAKERLSIRGPLTPLFGPDGLLENGLVEQVVEFIRRNIIVSARLVDGARREERWDYPEEAIREAVVNALVHRDYLLSSTDIEVSIYEDRLEIISPGHLPNGITPERMIVGCRAARNQLLKDVMRDYGYLEHMGMGVPRKIVKKMLEHNGTMPELIEEGERFMVRLLKYPLSPA
jgi:ATP-dependent DNA helicase RecG